MDIINLNETLAIDFGTTNSIVYYYQNHRYHAVPSVRYGLNIFRRFDPENPLFPSYVEYDGDRVVVGANARMNMGQPGKYVVSCVKRILGLTYDEYLEENKGRKHLETPGNTWKHLEIRCSGKNVM